jgi:hypothetical protein
MAPKRTKPSSVWTKLSFIPTGTQLGTKLGKNSGKTREELKNSALPAPDKTHPCVFRHGEFFPGVLRTDTPMTVNWLNVGDSTIPVPPSAHGGGLASIPGRAVGKAVPVAAIEVTQTNCDSPSAGARA